ncbi:hypothetical protein N656DRAFT_32699 [Canariomyces notabilis]|uniref:Uncharacterized protein n=1 Tax=Canariomyces notabilis TaxID=2074819 RepID=A0AAN6YXH5_9PEZI|nr:hypothetical protein N656DRAFT_32699 [Canariomyces arenarius]
MRQTWAVLETSRLLVGFAAYEPYGLPAFTTDGGYLLFRLDCLPFQASILEAYAFRRWAFMGSSTAWGKGGQGGTTISTPVRGLHDQFGGSNFVWFLFSLSFFCPSWPFVADLHSHSVEALPCKIRGRLSRKPPIFLAVNSVSAGEQDALAGTVGEMREGR